MSIDNCQVCDRYKALAGELAEAARLALAEAQSWIHDQLDGTGSLDGALRVLDPVRLALAKYDKYEQEKGGERNGQKQRGWEEKSLYALASPLGNASIAGNADISPPGEAGTMRIVAIQGAAEEYARQGNAVIDNKLWAKFGKEGA
jgi:hypothetical protein